MESIRSKYIKFIIVVLLLMAVIISYIYMVSLGKVERTYQNYAKDSIIDLKKIYLKDTVNNVILEIERIQKEHIALYKLISKGIGKTLDGFYKETEEMFLKLSIDFFSSSQNQAGFSLLIFQKVSGQIVYNSIPDSIIVINDPVLSTKEIENKFYIFNKNDYGIYTMIWGIDKKSIDEFIKDQIHDEIHSYRFSNDAYIWVNEVINYEGGDNYAIRRVHPNLKETEGTYLSTDMTDIKGNFPYLTELEGVKKDGELFFNYYFEKKNSDIISEKVTYAKLYKQYDWIIAMGVYLDDVDYYVYQTTTQSRKTTNNLMITMSVLIIAVILTELILMSFLEKWYNKKFDRVISEEIYKDQLTNTYNRRGAQKLMENAWKDYCYMGINSCIIMVDIDNFKQINDNYGHDRGDTMLINVSDTMSKQIRSTDLLSRWGGDEFLLICKGLQHDGVVTLTDKLLYSVSQIDCSDDTFKNIITISIGTSFFAASDKNYSQAIKRADIALYKSKDKGKNQSSIELLE
ncbi:MAG: diguanylate cyclase [Clostridiales bacterium]|nr:diguanylate cyclase [Clostridiales bacterium]